VGGDAVVGGAVTGAVDLGAAGTVAAVAGVVDVVGEVALDPEPAFFVTANPPTPLPVTSPGALS
jgi:hypothetical protein